MGAGRGGKRQRLSLEAEVPEQFGVRGCLSSAGLRSEAFELLFEVCDFFTEGRDFVFQVRYAVAIGGWNGGAGDGIRGRGRLRHTGICCAGVFHIAGKQVDVARFFGAGLSWKNSCQRRISLQETLQG